MLWVYAILFGASLVLALGLTPAVIAFAHKRKLYDPRSARKIHTTPIPRIGGVAIVTATMLTAIVGILLDNIFQNVFEEYQRQLWVLLGTSAFIFLLGIVDDIRDIPAKWKLLGQLLAAATVCAFGVRIEGVVLFNIDFGWLSWPITIIWIVAITNAVNLIDGLDGLSAGISAVACSVVAIFAAYTEQVAMTALMLALLGALIGFLVFNFNPAKIFMGDSGSMFLGFFLAVASVICATKVAAIMGLVLPALALGLPIFDMLLSVVRRVLDRRSIFAADRGHIHHRLMDRGLKHHHVVIVMYLVTMVAAGIGLWVMAKRPGGQGEVLVVLLVLLLLLMVFRVAGVLQFRSMWNQVKGNIHRGQEIRQERKQYEAMSNRLSRAWTFDQWWRAVRRMGRRMGFVEIKVLLRDGREECWRLADPPNTELMHLSLPVDRSEHSPLVRVVISAPVVESLETIGRRVSLFGRLLDEHALKPETVENKG